MNRAEFVRNIRIAVEQDAAQNVLESLNVPPGRDPSPALLNLSKRYHDLGDNERKILQDISRMVATHTTYSFLLVLDGLLAFDDSDPKGELELFHVRGEERLLLNDFDEQALSSLFKDVEFE